MIGAVLTPAEAQAIDDLEHDCDLIGRRPLACEIERVLSRARQQNDTREVCP